MLRRPAGLAAACLLAAVALLAAGCTDDDPAAPSAQATPSAPTVFAAERPAADPTRCSDLSERDNSGLAVEFAVPAGYGDTNRDDAACGFGRGFRTLGLSFGALPTLAQMRTEQIDSFVGQDGDDGLDDVAYADDVAVFGRVRGERLTYYCFCDGQSLDVLILQADGVRLNWTTPHGKGPTQRQVERLTDSVALVRARTSTCTDRGTTVVYAPPIPQTESIDGSGPGCHLYLQPGRQSLQRFAQVTPRPRDSLAEVAAHLRGRRHVTDIHLSGRRLTWRYTRTRPSRYGQPAGTWRLISLDRPGVRLTWSATPSQWRREHSAFRAFVRSASVRD